MDEELNTPSSGGTEHVHTSDDDTASITDYWEPGDDEPDTPEAGNDDATDEGAGDTEEQPEAEAPEASEEAPQAVFADETARVKLADGSEMTVADLIQGTMRQTDYTRKTQEVAEKRKSVESDAQRIAGITEAFIDHLSSMIPGEPPHSLALTDPSAYTRQKAQHDAALAQVQKLIEIGNQPRQITQAMSEADQQAQLAEANRQLVEMFPETATQDGRKRFWDETSSAAMEVGFTADELRGVSDPRMFALAHWARKGMAADKAAAAAKAKVAKAPPVAPNKPGQGIRDGGRNVEAMRKLSRSGSLKDALAVDFD